MNAKQAEKYWEKRLWVEVEFGNSANIAQMILDEHKLSPKSLDNVAKKLIRLRSKAESLLKILVDEFKRREMDIDGLLEKALNNYKPDYAMALLSWGAKPTPRTVEVVGCLASTAFFKNVSPMVEVLIAVLEAGGDPKWIARKHWNILTKGTEECDPVHKADGPGIAAWMRAQILAREMEGN